MHCRPFLKLWPASPSSPSYLLHWQQIEVIIRDFESGLRVHELQVADDGAFVFGSRRDIELGARILYDHCTTRNRALFSPKGWGRHEPRPACNYLNSRLTDSTVLVSNSGPSFHLSLKPLVQSRRPRDHDVACLASRSRSAYIQDTMAPARECQ